MWCPDSPVVVPLLPSEPVPRPARLADVLVVVTDHPRAADLATELLDRYPGAAITVVGGSTGVVIIGVRLGTSLVRYGVWSSLRPSVPLLSSIGRSFYAVWAVGSRDSHGSALRRLLPSPARSRSARRCTSSRPRPEPSASKMRIASR